jgi:hypothetical protein
MNPASSYKAARALKRGRGPTRKLPDEIDFLRHDFPLSRLEEAVERARELGVGVDELLIAEGWIPETAYYARLAISLDADFLGGPLELDPSADWRAALRTGVCRLADGRWLMAPRGAGVSALAPHITPELAHARLALATPRDFERAVFANFADEIAQEAAEALLLAHPDFSARSGANSTQKLLAIALCILLPVELAFGLHVWAVAFVLVATIMCVAVVVRIVATGLALAPSRAVRPLSDAELPTYSVLVALYDESEVAARLAAAMAALDYPTAKHEVIFIIEAGDRVTRSALELQELPAHFRIIVAPDGAPRTKPRALNIGLLVARGERLVIYDAEDRPEPDQLRKAAARFRAGSPKLAALQAQLRIENPTDSWLTRLFALDYAAQFDVLLPGMARLGAPLPLGGTSNHFSTRVLREVGGWDAWNVTEDADLGLRLARLGYRCETLRSITFEEAPPTLYDWFPQRRRWLKGWMRL